MRTWHPTVLVHTNLLQLLMVLAVARSTRRLSKTKLLHALQEVRACTVATLLRLVLPFQVKLVHSCHLVTPSLLMVLSSKSVLPCVSLPAVLHRSQLIRLQGTSKSHLRTNDTNQPTRSLSRTYFRSYFDPWLLTALRISDVDDQGIAGGKTCIFDNDMNLFGTWMGIPFAGDVSIDG
jgi:hypothetical protein